MEKVLLGRNIIIVVSHICQVLLSSDKGNLSEPIILGIECLSLQIPQKVVPNHMNLIEASPESLRGGQIGYISQSKNVLVFFVLESVNVHVQKPVSSCKSGFHQVVVRFAREHLVKVIVRPFFCFPTFDVLESG